MRWKRKDRDDARPARDAARARVVLHGRRAEKTKDAKPKAVRFRPIGDRVLVMFEQSDWEVQNGLIVKTGLVGVGYRMDGVVVAVGPKVPKDIGVGSTVYADPRTGEIVKFDRTRYHLMRFGDLLAVAEQGGNDNG